MSLRPSSLPMLERCPAFESGETEFSKVGTLRHDYFADLVRWHLDLSGAQRSARPTTPDELSDEDCDGVEWAAEYVAMLRNPDFALDSEHRLSLLNEDFEEVLDGTPDTVNGPRIWDLKWRERDYTAQMAAYALMLIQARGYGQVEVELLFAERKRVERLVFDRVSAEGIVFPIMEAYRQSVKEPEPNEYCGWCAKRVSCPALTDRAFAVARGREDWKLEQYHSSAIGEAAEMAKALRLARELKGWCEGVEFHAKEMAMGGKSLPGFELKPTAGKHYCKDVSAAFNLMGLPNEAFLKACDVRLNRSKKYPDKEGLSELLMAQTGMKKATAQRDVKRRLKDVLARGDGSVKLVAVGQSEESEE